RCAPVDAPAHGRTYSRHPCREGRPVVEIPPEVQRRLMGLIPVERIRAVRIPRPDSTLLARYRALDEPTPLLADALDALGINGIVAASLLRPVVAGKTIVGP